MNYYTKNEVKALLEENNLSQPKAKYSNNVILSMLDKVNDNTIFEVEPTKKGFKLNRGTLVEEIVKSILGVKVNKSYSGKADIDLKDVDNSKYGLPTYAKKIEVKFATTFAPASASNPNTKYVILITNEGAFLMNANEHEGRYTNYSAYDGTKLNKLSEMLGF